MLFVSNYCTMHRMKSSSIWVYLLAFSACTIFDASIRSSSSYGCENFFCALFKILIKSSTSISSLRGLSIWIITLAGMLQSSSVWDLELVWFSLLFRPLVVFLMDGVGSSLGSSSSSSSLSDVISAFPTSCLLSLPVFHSGAQFRWFGGRSLFLMWIH